MVCRIKKKKKKKKPGELHLCENFIFKKIYSGDWAH